MGNSVDYLQAHILAAGSALAAHSKRAEALWRKKTAFDRPGDVLLRWRYARLRPTDDWAHIDGSKGASGNPATWRDDVIAVTHENAVRADGVAFDLAVAYMLGSAGMVGTLEAPDDWLGAIDNPKYRINTAPAHGVVVRTGPGPNVIAIGRVLRATPNFVPFPTHYLGTAAEVGAVALRRV